MSGTNRSGPLGERLFRAVPGSYRLMLLATRLYRPTLGRVCFVGVTGSGGKTTTKELIALVLARRGPVTKTPSTLNELGEVALTILRTRPWHRACVLEAAAAHRGPGSVGRIVALARPRIGVVTNVRSDHIHAFGSLEAIAQEKGELVAALPADGVAVLNADDPRVLGMAARCRARVVTYGLGEAAALRARDVTAAWPDRLAFTVEHETGSVRVQTRLCGEMWLTPLLAALASGLAMGIPLAEAVAALAHAEPMPGRMQPLLREDGVSIVADYWKASLWTIGPALEFVAAARARRKVVVLGTLSDYVGDSGRKYVEVARDALRAADHVCFVGPRATQALRARRGAADGGLRAFASVDAALAHLRALLQPGDLVLVKGSGMADGLGALVRGLMAEQGAAAPAAPVPAATMGAPPGGAEARGVIGFGNPGAQLEGTPHNVGWVVLDRVADQLGAAWTMDDRAAVARVEREGATVYLIKPLAGVNVAGSVLASLVRRLGVAPEACVLVHDDVNLEIGAVRERLRGGDGGHQGVRSVLHAFQTDLIARVKVGVGSPPDRAALREYVLTPFAPDQRPAVDRACEEAVGRVLKLVGQPARQVTR